MRPPVLLCDHSCCCDLIQVSKVHTLSDSWWNVWKNVMNLVYALCSVHSCTRAHANARAHANNKAQARGHAGARARFRACVSAKVQAKIQTWVLSQLSSLFLSLLLSKLSYLIQGASQFLCLIQGVSQFQLLIQAVLQLSSQTQRVPLSLYVPVSMFAPDPEVHNPFLCPVWGALGAMTYGGFLSETCSAHIFVHQLCIQWSLQAVAF